MPSLRAGRCFEGERGENVEDAYHRGLFLCGCIKILKAAEGRKQQKRWLLLLPMANTVAPSPGAVRQRDGANSQGWYSHQGVTLRGFHFLLLNWDYPQLSVLLQHKTVCWESVCALTVCPCMSKSVLWCVGGFFLFMAHQMVWWCASHLVRVLGHRQLEWENFFVVQIWDGKRKDTQECPTDVIEC